MTTGNTSGTNGPLADEFEVSIFGPGKGEAVAVHLGGGDWITVDSCIEQGSGAHPVLRYFAEIGVDPGTQVRLVVGTHAHDDHIAGISRLFKASSAAKYVSSIAFTSEEFFATVEADTDVEGQLRQTVRSEFRKIFDEVKVRAAAAKGFSPWLPAVEQRTLWSRPASEGVAGATVTALSPSDTAILRSKNYLADGSARAGDRRRLSRADPNDFSVALWVQFGEDAVLLGADLEKGPAGCGWQAVIRSHHPTNRARLFKVPHHGSKYAHYPSVWTDLLTSDAVAVLAPFRAGTVNVPSPGEVQMLLSLSERVYSTAAPKQPAPGKKVKKAKASLEGLVRNVREPYGLVGQVQARLRPPSQQWDIKLSSPALRLTQRHAT